MNPNNRVFSIFLHALSLLLVLALGRMPAIAQEAIEQGESETLEYPISAPSDSGMYDGINNLPESIRRSAPFARALNEMTRRASTSGTFDIEARVRAFNESQGDLRNSAVAEKSIGQSPLMNAWTNIGVIGSPSNGVYSAGCTAALAIDPTNTNVIYAGATSGGIWKSTDAGGHWAELTDIVIPNLAIASIAIDPKNHNTIYVGTGNGYASVDELTGTGIYKSTNGGGTWTRIGAPSITGTVIKVMVDPVSSNVIFASLYTTNRGVWRSSDSGVTWSRVFPTTGSAAGVVWDMVVGSVITNIPILYFAEGNNPGGSSQECGVYISVNDGVSWSKIPGFPRGDSIGRCALAASVVAPSRVFAFMANPNGDEISTSRALFSSIDNGVTWHTTAIPNTLFRPIAGSTAQGWYDCLLGVSPYSNSGHDTIYIGGVEGYVNYNDGSGWNQWAGYSSPYYDWFQFPHVDQHSIAFNPRNPTQVYIGCDGGVYLSQDAGYSWTYRSNQMVTGRFYRIGLSPTDYKTTLAGAQDQGTWSIVTGGVTEMTGLGGDGSQPIISPVSANTVYSELSEGTIYKSTVGIGCGQCWNRIDGSISDTPPWDAPMKMSSAALGTTPAYNILYVGHPHLWRTLNAGASWTAISPQFSNGPINAIGISLVDSYNIYVGLQNGIMLTTNAGNSWTQKLTSSPMVTSIVTTGRDTNFALASFYTSSGARVMRSTNKGASWTNVSGLSGSILPAVGVNCVALDSINPRLTWYAATDNGMYYTIDSGSHWKVAGSGLGLAPCRDVQVQANKMTIRVATFGRGIWEANANVLPIELSSLTYQKTPHGTQLLWHTDSERGNRGFYVERSVNSASFEDIGFVPSEAAGGISNMQLNYSWFDSTHANGIYLYQLKQVDLDGTEHFSNHVEVHYGNDQMIVYQNYPNPLVIGTPLTSQSNPFGSDNSIVVAPALETRIEYELPDNDVVTLKIYNSTGKLVRTLFESASQMGGEQDAFWDGRADDGAVAPSGAYFYVIQSQQYGTFVNKMMLLSN